MHGSVFTTAAVDNIDHNPSSSTAKGSFHGTAISLFQHPDYEGDGEKMEQIDLQDGKTAQQHILDYYTKVPPLTSPPKDIKVPAATTQLVSEIHEEGYAIQQESDWLQYVHTHYKDEPTKNLNLSWAAFHANKQQALKPKCPGRLLPLFEDPSNSPSMIRHAMDVIKHAITYLNPGQIPVLTCDQPLYKFAKSIQWTWPESYGEDKFVVIMGGFHIEQAAWSVVGTWLEDSS